VASVPPQSGSQTAEGDVMVSGGDVPSSQEVYVGRPMPVTSHVASLLEGSNSQVAVTEDGRLGIRKDDINVHEDSTRNDDTSKANLFELDGVTSGSSFEPIVGLLHSSDLSTDTVLGPTKAMDPPASFGSTEATVPQASASPAETTGFPASSGLAEATTASPASPGPGLAHTENVISQTSPDPVEATVSPASSGPTDAIVAFLASSGQADSEATTPPRTPPATKMSPPAPRLHCTPTKFYSRRRFGQSCHRRQERLGEPATDVEEICPGLSFAVQPNAASAIGDAAAADTVPSAGGGSPVPPLSVF
jgi:hypothetical protein